MLSAIVLAIAMQNSAAAPGCDLIRASGAQQAGREALARRQYDAAVQRFTEALTFCPSSRSIPVDLAETQIHRKQFAEAIRLAKDVLAAEPSSLPARLVMANAYFMSQRFAEALREADQALRIQAFEPAAMKVKANSEYLLGSLDKASNTLMALMEHSPNDVDAPYMLGRMYYQDGRIDHARGLFQRVLRMDPRSYRAYDNLGLCYEARGDSATAIRYYLTAIKLVETEHPEYDSVYANLASILIDTGDAEHAFGAASKAADRNPYSARNFYLGGKALAKLGKNELAANWLERAAALDANYSEPLYLLARLYSQLGQAEKAKTTLARFNEVKARAPRERK
jgi:tetratricopeptide (TPR) repeat protein